MTVAIAPTPAVPRAYSPSVAIGLRGLTLALKAKGGGARRDEAMALACDAVAMLPAEEGLHRALARFEAHLCGDTLLDFLRAWSADLPVDRTEEALHDMAPDHFHWTDRKDCGHD